MIELLPILIQQFQLDPERARRLLEMSTISIDGQIYTGDPFNLPPVAAANKTVEIRGANGGFRVQIVG